MEKVPTRVPSCSSFVLESVSRRACQWHKQTGRVLSLKEESLDVS